MTKRILTFLLLLALPLCMIAQTLVSGTVTDAESGEPLIGANILIQNTSTGTTTDLEGKYQFCLLYTSPSPRDRTRSRMPSSA